MVSVMVRAYHRMQNGQIVQVSEYQQNREGKKFEGNAIPKEFREKIAEKESSTHGLKEIHSESGALGRYQFKPDTLFEMGMIDKNSKNANWTKKAESVGVRTNEDFLNSESAQEFTFSEMMEYIHGKFAKNGSFRHLGQIIKGIKENIEIDVPGLMAAGHRAGAGAVKKYLSYMEQHKWESNSYNNDKTLPLRQRKKFLAIETRLREFKGEKIQ
ncbi:MAG: hypothetical protein K2Q10_12175 [Rhodospirillales bacterium]|nr:hypothetical protein [Rhodospirillales bacterium]